jgi:hypothetical protein
MNVALPNIAYYALKGDYSSELRVVGGVATAYAERAGGGHLRTPHRTLISDAIMAQ